MLMEILLLTQIDCAFCDTAKELVDRLADEYGLSTATLDLATPEGRTVGEESGILFPPGILIDGGPVSYGRPSERRLRREIERRVEAGRNVR